uniref:Uncharacterized protein n=1 Tax=Sphaerodactylus townsendi TaxID=933632 RepID=A0ACB8FU74_9SAUR
MLPPLLPIAGPSKYLTRQTFLASVVEEEASARPHLPSLHLTSPHLAQPSLAWPTILPETTWTRFGKWSGLPTPPSQCCCLYDGMMAGG